MDRIISTSLVYAGLENAIEEEFFNLLIEKGYEQNINIALKYYQNLELSLNEYTLLIDFFNYIDSTDLEPLLYSLFQNDMIFEIDSIKIKEVKEFYLGDKTFKCVAFGLFHQVGIAKNGSIKCFGDNHNQQLENIPQGNRFTSVECGKYHSVALDEDGRIYCWGNNDFDQLRNIPQETGFISISCGANHTAALNADGTIRCWGENYFWQLTNPPQGNDFIFVQCGLYHSVAMRQDKTIYGWGDNSYNQLTYFPQNKKFEKIICRDYYCIGLNSYGTPQYCGIIIPYHSKYCRINMVKYITLIKNETERKGNFLCLSYKFFGTKEFSDEEILDLWENNSIFVSNMCNKSYLLDKNGKWREYTG